MEQASKWMTASGRQNLEGLTIIKIATAPTQKVRTSIIVCVLPSTTISISRPVPLVHQWLIDSRSSVEPLYISIVGPTLDDQRLYATIYSFPCVENILSHLAQCLSNLLKE